MGRRTCELFAELGVLLSAALARVLRRLNPGPAPARRVNGSNGGSDHYLQGLQGRAGTRLQVLAEVLCLGLGGVRAPRGERGILAGLEVRLARHRIRRRCPQRRELCLRASLVRLVLGEGRDLSG